MKQKKERMPLRMAPEEIQDRLDAISHGNLMPSDEDVAYMAARDSADPGLTPEGMQDRLDAISRGEIIPTKEDVEYMAARDRARIAAEDHE